MKRKIIGILALAFASMFLFSACGKRDLIRTVDSLLTPPLYYSEYEGLVKAFNTAAGDNVILCNPTSGNYLSAITVFDLDGDKTEEALIFYRYAQDSLNVRFALFDCNNGVWSKKGDYIGFGDKVYSLDFMDLDGDSNCEIIVHWCYSAITTTNVITAYKATASEKYIQILMDSCEFSNIYDYDGDGCREIMYISTGNNTSGANKKAHLMKIIDGKFYETGCANVDPNVISYAGFNQFEDDEGVKIYIDAVKAGNTMITEVLCWDKTGEGLVNMFYDEETGTNTATLRYDLIPCTDIDSDGEPEIPTQSYNPEEEKKTEILTLWNKLTENGLNPVTETYVSVSEGYIINLDFVKKCSPQIIRTGKRASSLVTVYAGLPEDNVVLFTLNSVNGEGSDEEAEKGTPVLKSGEWGVYVSAGSGAKAYGISEKEIVSSITNLPT